MLQISHRRNHCEQLVHTLSQVGGGVQDSDTIAYVKFIPKADFEAVLSLLLLIRS